MKIGPQRTSLPRSRPLLTYGLPLAAALFFPCLGCLELFFPFWTVWQVNASPIYCACFFPDGRRVLIAHWDGTLRVCSTETGEELRCFDGGSQAANCSVAVSPDGTRAVSTSNGSYDHVSGVRLWDVATGGQLCRFAGHTAGVTSVVFCPDGRHVLTGSRDRTLRLWDADNGKEVTLLCRKPRAKVSPT